jgi:signal peptidase I
MPDVAEPMTEAAAEKKKKKRDLTHPRDHFREVIETVVFVVVLVLLLKLFITEAFVIPTGSMAETLYGYQKIITCPKCGHEFPVNAHDEAEGNQVTGVKMPLYGYCCPNCRHLGHVKDLDPPPKGPNTGDRVLVLKPLFHVRQPKRGEVVVFKWPEKPQDKQIAQNYIKRCMAFGGETVAVYRGELFVTRSLEYPANALDENGTPLYPRPDDPLDLWRPHYMYSTVWDSNPLAEKFFELSRNAGFPQGDGRGFEIIRKGEEQILADRRVVWDNDKQPKELAGKVPKRWYPEARSGARPGEVLPWNGNDEPQPTAFRHDKPELDWLRYRHLAMPWKTKAADASDQIPATDFAALASQPPTFIDNFLGYNAGRDLDPTTGRVEARDNTGQARLWVGDLILECRVTFEAGSKVVLELSKGINRFQAEFEAGKVTLRRIGVGAAEFKEPSRPCKVGPGAHDLRFANVDCRLLVWVDGKLIDFGNEGDYTPPTPEQEAAFKDAKGNPDMSPEGWTNTNDVLAPASVGAAGGVGVQNIKLFRDVYYTRQSQGPIDHAKADIFYVQPGHFMCLGDNSAQSSDSRKWGVVPERLMLGKAVFVFWPAPLFGTPNRIGFIK